MVLRSFRFCCIDICFRFIGGVPQIAVVLFKGKYDYFVKEGDCVLLLMQRIYIYEMEGLSKKKKLLREYKILER